METVGIYNCNILSSLMSRTVSFISPTLLLLLFSCPVMSNSLWAHGLQHAGLPCPTPSPGVCPSTIWGFRTLLWVPWEAVWFCTVNCNLLICIRVWVCISYFLLQIIIKPDILISSSRLMNKNFVLINNYKQMQSWKQHSLCAKQEL